MAIRSTSTNIDIGNATTETGTQRPPTVTSTPGKAEQHFRAFDLVFPPAVESSAIGVLRRQCFLLV